MSPMPTDAILVVLYEGVSGAEALGAHAALKASDLPVELVAPEALVRTIEGPRVVPDRLGYDAIATAPAVVLPHGDVRKPLADASLARALRARRGHATLASGDAARLLHAASLTEGRKIARAPGDPPIAGATGVHAPLVADARLLTCFPGDALVDLVLHFVGHEHGDDTARRAAQRLGREYRPFAYGQQRP